MTLLMTEIRQNTIIIITDPSQNIARKNSCQRVSTQIMIMVMTDWKENLLLFYAYEITLS
jgi:hypothetical protein